MIGKTVACPLSPLVLSPLLLGPANSLTKLLSFSTKNLKKCANIFADNSKSRSILAQRVICKGIPLFSRKYLVKVFPFA
jgi:hypothetical protein